LKNVCVVAISAALVAGIPAMASTLCPGDATQGTYISATFTAGSTPTGPGGTCTAGSVNVSIPNAHLDEAGLKWGPSTLPGGLTFGNLGGLDASISDLNGNQPYFFLGFNDANLAPAATPGDELLFIEFQPNNVVGGTSMPVDPATTLFNLYDNDTNVYLAGGQADKHTLDDWMSMDSSVSRDSIQKIEVAIGLAGGCATGGCPDSVTVNSVSVAQTPEPGTIVSVATGLLCLGSGLAFRRRKLVQAV
jgi:hypothetical protein